MNKSISIIALFLISSNLLLVSSQMWANNYTLNSSFNANGNNFPSQYNCLPLANTTVNVTTSGPNVTFAVQFSNSTDCASLGLNLSLTTYTLTTSGFSASGPGSNYAVYLNSNNTVFFWTGPTNSAWILQTMSSAVNGAFPFAGNWTVFAVLPSAAQCMLVNGTGSIAITSLPNMQILVANSTNSAVNITLNTTSGGVITSTTSSLPLGFYNPSNGSIIYQTNTCEYILAPVATPSGSNAIAKAVSIGLLAVFALLTL